MTLLCDEFECELARIRDLAALRIIVEGDLRDVLNQSRTVGLNAILGTVAAWSRRYGPVLFAGNVHTAADLAYRFPRRQVREIERAAKAIAKTDASTAS